MHQSHNGFSFFWTLTFLVAGSGPVEIFDKEQFFFNGPVEIWVVIAYSSSFFTNVEGNNVICRGVGDHST